MSCHEGNAPFNKHRTSNDRANGDLKDMFITAQSLIQSKLQTIISLRVSYCHSDLMSLVIILPVKSCKYLLTTSLLYYAPAFLVLLFCVLCNYDLVGSWELPLFVSE